MKNSNSVVVLLSCLRKLLQSGNAISQQTKSPSPLKVKSTCSKSLGEVSPVLFGGAGP